MKRQIYLLPALVFFVIFIVFTVVVKTCDVAYLMNVDDLYLNKVNAYIGLSHFNIGTNYWVNHFEKLGAMKLISDIYLYISLVFPVGFFIGFIYQWISRKSFKKIDRMLLLMLASSIMVVIVYLFFEIFKVNYAPDAINNDELHASYPSSHVFVGGTFLTTGFLTLIYYLKIKNTFVKAGIFLALIALESMTTLARLLSGKHWASDIIASSLLVLTFVSLFYYLEHYFVLKEFDSSIEVAEKGEEQK